MIKGFRDFIMRGNVVDLAVAVVIGTAFTALVTAMANNLIKPLLAAVGQGDAPSLGWQIVDKPGAFMDFGAIIASIINFLIVAAVVYFLVVTPMNKLAELRKKGHAPEPAAPAEDILLLQEIRDLLKDRNVRA